VELEEGAFSLELDVTFSLLEESVFLEAEDFGLPELDDIAELSELVDFFSLDEDRLSTLDEL
jgi:hypothetical protein